jgi:hypothetical protein
LAGPVQGDRRSVEEPSIAPALNQIGSPINYFLII